MNKMNSVAKFGAGAVGALALTLGATGVAAAQDSDAETTDPVVTEDEATTDRSARHEARRAQRAERRADVADIIGISSEDLSAAREDGQSLADIAGDAFDELVEYFVEQATSRVDGAVENGRLTEDEAVERLDGVEERITERLENADRSDREGRRSHRGHRGHGGYNGAPAETATVDS